MPETPRVPVSEPNENIYNLRVLRWVYTPVAIQFSHRFAWRVPNRLLHRNHADYVGDTHLSVGPGNGYFLARLPRDTRLRRLHLLDLNPACLRITADRMAERFRVRVHRADALRTWPLATGSVDSVDAHMMAHTLPGDRIGDKEGLFAEAARVLRPGGTFFGATILASGAGVRHGWLARRLMRLYNGQQNTFSNAGDTAEDLTHMLERHFTDVDLRVHGCVGVWTAVTR